MTSVELQARLNDFSNDLWYELLFQSELQAHLNYYSNDLWYELFQNHTKN